MKKSPYGKLKRVILASMILVPLATLILILGIGYYYFTTSLESSTIATVKRIVADHRHMIDSFLSNRKANLEFILHSYSFKDLADPEMLHKTLKRLQKESDAFVDIGLFNEEGMHVNYQGPYRLVGKDYAEARWFKEVMTQGAYISDVFLGYRRIPHFIIALRKTENGQIWVLRATIDTQMFNQLVKSVRIGKTGEAYLLNAEGVFQTERRSGGNLMEKDPEKLKTPSPQTGIKAFIAENIKGEPYLYATTWLREKDWLLVVRQEKADAFRFLHTAAYIIVIVALLGGGAIVGLALFLTNRIIRRMERMDAEREQLGGQLIRASRLAELGEMATGFAHEINNPLQVMKSEQALMDSILLDVKDKGTLKPSDDLKELEDSIQQIGLQTGRCAEITQSILQFGRQSEPVLQDVDLRTFIPEVTKMVEKKADVHGISLKQRISDDLPPVHGDRGQLQQVLLNLFNNAMDAILMRHGAEGGELVVEAGAGEESKAYIRVKDNGIGINAGDLKRIFTPFFTTKPPGKGTGLGLSVCYGIVDKMGGTMTVVSEKGEGSIFTITLPAARSGRSE
ncbi:MAG: two-component sensor histidine kinase [Deltaproteobacteria bacterium]|nr:two-component sensor histidine kinase [Deltaproteobacteria bacterium]